MLRELRSALLPPRMIAKITSVNSADGTVNVQTDSGYAFRAVGSGTVNTYVYVQDGMVIGQASTLPFATVDV